MRLVGPMSTPRPARRVFTGDFTADRAQQNGTDAQRRLNDSIFAGGVVIDAESGQPAGSGLTFVAGTARTFAHGLGKKARFVLELYGVDVPSAGVVGLRTTALPSGVSSATHVTVTPTNSGKCSLAVI